MSQPHRFSNPRCIRESLLTQAGYPFRYQSWQDVPVALRIRILEHIAKQIEAIRQVA